MKTHLICFLAAAILGSGLISCAADNPQGATDTTPERLPAPDLREKDQSWDVKLVTPAKDQSWTLSSQLTFQDIGAFNTIHITSRCLWNGLELKNELTLPMKPQFRLRDFLPEELFVIRFDGRIAPCEFRFLATTSNGSRHQFEIREVRLTDGETSDLTLREESFSLDKSAAQVSLKCGEHTMPALRPTEQMRELRDFAMSVGSWLKNCRLIARNADGAIQALSPMLDLSGKMPSITATDQSSSQLNWDVLKKSDLFQDFNFRVYQGDGYPVIFISINNPTNETLWIDAPMQLNHGIWGMDLSGHGLSSPRSFLTLQGEPRRELAPGANVNLIYNINVNAKTWVKMPWLIQIHKTPPTFQVFARDPLHGLAENDHLVPWTIAVPQMNTKLILSEGTLEDALILFKDVL